MCTREDIKRNIIDLLKVRNSTKRLSENQGIPTSTISTWKSWEKDSIPNVLQAYKIAKEFNVPIEYLVKGEEAQLKITDSDNEILSLLQNLNEKEKQEVMVLTRNYLYERRRERAKRGTESGTQAG